MITEQTVQASTSQETLATASGDGTEKKELAERVERHVVVYFFL